MVLKKLMGACITGILVLLLGVVQERFSTQLMETNVTAIEATLERQLAAINTCRVVAAPAETPPVPRAEDVAEVNHLLESVASQLERIKRYASQVESSIAQIDKASSTPEIAKKTVARQRAITGLP